jgi:hypothetical protein
VIDVFLQMAALLGCGVAWRALRPGGLDAETTRRVLAGVVYHLLLPALVLVVLWRAPVGADTLRIAVVAGGGVVTAFGLAWAAYRLFRLERAPLLALLLASAFGNVTYLGLPVLESTLGPWARSVAFMYDLFACTPLLLLIDAWLARGSGAGDRSWGKALLRVPPLWAAALALALNFAEVPCPEWLEMLLQRLGVPVVPLMLFSVGLALSWQPGWGRRLGILIPSVVIQLVVTPLVVAGLADGVGLSGDLRRAVVLEAAMPTMVLGIVVCDRHRLDTPLYAEALTVSTALSVASLPLWLHVLG